MRADALHRLLLSRRGQVSSLDEIPRLSDLFSWPSRQIDIAIADLVADGRLADDAYGRLHVEPMGGAAA